VGENDVICAVNDLMRAGRAPTTDLLASRLGLDRATMLARLTQLETKGKLMSVVQWGQTPGMGEHQWVRPGAAADYLSPQHYDEFEHRVRTMAAWKGYELVKTREGTPRQCRYTIVTSSDHPTATVRVRGEQIETVLWRLRQIPTVAELDSSNALA
jgi:hypothetical protein